MAPTATSAQRGIWFTERCGPVGAAYHMALRIGFEVGLDRRALADACAAVVRDHPLLDAAFAEVEGVLVPRPCGRTAEPVRVDCAGDDPAGLEKRIADAVAVPFDLSAGPLIRFTLFELADGGAELLVVAHHAVFDGMSKDVLADALAGHYAAALTGSAAPARPAAPPPEAALTEQQLADARRWFDRRWTEPGPLLLPGARHGSVTAAPGAEVEWTLPAALDTALTATARRLSASRFELLLAAVHALLRRYGNTDPAVSVAMSTRGPEQRALIGPFVNELPLRAPAGSGHSFAVLVHALHTELREANRHRAVPPGAVVAGLTPRTGLTPASLGYRRRAAAPEFPGVRTRVRWMVFNRTARNTFHLQAVEGPEGCELSLQYPAGVLDREQALRITGHLETLLGAALADPDLPVADLPLPAAPELRLLLREWNATGRDYPADRTVVDLFDAQAAARPDALAVTGPGGGLTYAELRARSVELAVRLRAAGIGPGALVGVHLHRTERAVVALLGVLRSGAAYVPLDPAYPADRLAYVLADSGAALLLADGELEPRLAARAPGVLRLDVPGPGSAGAAHSADDSASLPPTEPAGLAYVLYTSGSTGRPKGVAVGHRALVNLLTSFAADLDSGPGHVWLGLTSLSFDISGLETFLPLITGGRLVVVPDGMALNGPALLRLIAAEGVTHAQATPSGWRVLLAGGLRRAALEESTGPAGLTALVGGEALPLALARELRAATARLLNVYGPTETTIWSTRWEVPERPERVSIGTPIGNTRVHVVDERLRPAPVGVPGELLIGGDGLADGYLGRPGPTADRFVPDPFGPPGARLYRTGDLAAWNAAGEVDFLGRMDDQVKMRGHRIEVGEIESRLLEHPDIAGAAVVAEPDPQGEARLIAYLVGEGAPPPEGAEIRAFLARRLPAAMVPQLFVPLDALPLTPNGKLDRKALPTATAAPVESSPGGADSDVTRELLAIWAEVLGTPDVGPDDDLFDLGGHSLTIIQIGVRIRERFDVELDFDVFFDTPTVTGIARVVEAAL